mgnify:CR=1 FL=1
MEKYKHDENYSFFFYTNGMYLKKYLKELVEFNEVLGQRRLSLQVSYDGKAVNDIMAARDKVVFAQQKVLAFRQRKAKLHNDVLTPWKRRPEGRLFCISHYFPLNRASAQVNNESI